MEEECKEAECKQEQIRQMDLEDLERIVRKLREWEEKAKCSAEEELIWHTLKEEEVARAAELPPQDENNEVLDYYNDLDQDTEMVSSQETVPMSSQDTAPTSSQETVPMVQPGE